MYQLELVIAPVAIAKIIYCNSIFFHKNYN